VIKGLLTTVLSLAVGQIPTLAVPADAVELALADAKQYADSRFLRYIWLSGKDNLIDDMRVVSYAMNLISRSSVKYRPVPIANERTVVLRIDTRLYAPNKEIDSFLNAWEDLKYDPKFSGLITQGSLQLAKIDPAGISRRIKFRAGGLAFLEEESASSALKKDGVLRFTPSKLNPNWDVLATLLRTEAPVIDHHYFIFRSMHAIRDEKDRALFGKVFGGLYYNLSGVPGGTKNDLNELLRSLGVGTSNQDYKKIFESLRSDQRVAMFRSNVTGRMRRIELFKTLSGRESQGIFSITSDFAESDIDVDTSPIANLLNVNGVKAHEVIWEKPNGLHGFALYDGNGKRQDEAPPDIVRDFLAKAPHSTRLQPAFSCIRCHGREDGWIPVHNDVKTMLATKRVDIFGDLSRKFNQQDAIDRIVGLYMGDFANVFRRGRDDYGVNILSTTGPWPKSTNQLDIVKQTARQMEDIVDRYWYRQVGPQEAMAELGFDIPEKNADLAFAAYVLKINHLPILEDSRVAALRANIKILRPEFSFIYSFIMK
jgi:hypothetical protein